MKYYLIIAGLFLSMASYADNKKVDVCDTALERSTLIINQLLADLNKTYSHTGGGGITKIQEISSNTYVISIAQEERIDQIQYKVSLDKSCQLSILEKNESAKSFY